MTSAPNRAGRSEGGPGLGRAGRLPCIGRAGRARGCYGPRAVRRSPCLSLGVIHM